MASSIMDFLMLALVGGGALFVYINRDCIMSGTCFGPGGGGGDVCASQPTAPGCPRDPCVLNPNDIGCGGGGGTGGADCGQLCREKKCTSYKSHCTAGCKYCCGSGPNSPKCGGTPGSQCGDLCRLKNCVSYANQCTGGCSNCPANPSLALYVVQHCPSGFKCSCGSGSTSSATCVQCTTCTNNTQLCSAAISQSAYSSGPAMMTALMNSYRSKHPNGCGTTGGCTRTCSNGFRLNTNTCTCACNPGILNCTASNKCVYQAGSGSSAVCKCLSTGGSSGCNSGYHVCKDSSGRCQCCKNAVSGDSCAPFTGGTYCLCEGKKHCSSTQHGCVVKSPCGAGGLNYTSCCSCCPGSSYTNAKKQAVLAKYNPNSYRVRLA